VDKEVDMTNELGKVERPEAEPFRKVRKLYLVPTAYSTEEAPADYVDMCNRYWEGVRSSLESLEARAGRVDRVYHEVVSNSGEEGLKMMQMMDPKAHELVKLMVERGAVVEGFEDEEILSEYMDWQRCLSIGLMSQKVAEEISRSYFEAAKNRFDHLSKRLGESLGQEETGLLLIGEDHKIQFPADVEVFYVSPPALDEIHRWRRQQNEHRHGEPGRGAQEQVKEE
jgi:hypothetical protein